MNFFTLIFTTILLSFDVTDLMAVEKLKLARVSPKQTYIFDGDNRKCITNINPADYAYDLWFIERIYSPNSDPHLICCNESFSADTIIPSIIKMPEANSLEILKNDFDILTKDKTNCSIYYGHWLLDGDIPNIGDRLSVNRLTIHPITLTTLLGH